ncbi:unnamed protein product [Rotaria sp. Silwood1]|nr:unnamed protein product [Rotaria sp. Silwood1]
MRIAVRRRYTTIWICVLIIIFVVLIIHTIKYALRRRSPRKYLNEIDLSRYANVTWPRRRVPRIIHQTYRTYDIPAIWNQSVQSVMTMNAGEFQYRRWSHADMDAFVRQHEPHFYWNTFVKYRYDMQRIDSFRYVLMFYLGGIYIDMDNGCTRPFREFVATMEALDPDSPYLTLFQDDDVFGLQTDFIISTAGHPIYKQFISQLPYFNHYFLLHHITILLSAGPLFAGVQERFFHQTDEQVGKEIVDKWPQGSIKGLPVGWTCELNGCFASGSDFIKGTWKCQGPESKKEEAYKIVEKYYDGFDVHITWENDSV